MTNDEELIASELLGEALKPLEIDLQKYGLVSKRLWEMLQNNFNLKPEIKKDHENKGKEKS